MKSTARRTLVLATVWALGFLAAPAGAAPDPVEPVYAWGDNDEYQSGQRDRDEDYTGAMPVCSGTGNCGASETFTKATAVAAGDYHSLAVVDGKVWAWGKSENGRLGFRTTEQNSLPQHVCAPTQGAGCTDLTDVRKIAAGGSHSMAILSDGSIATWGRNNVGQLGVSMTSSDDRDIPKVVCENNPASPCEDGARDISGGYEHSLAVTQDGTVLAWGGNASGQVGKSDTGKWFGAPQKVTMPERAKARAVAAGDYHSLALLTDGRVVTWGYNREGQLGHGTIADAVELPRVVEGPLKGKQVKAIAAGERFSMALTTGGTVYTWGQDDNGQLGTSRTGNSGTPREVCSPWSCDEGDTLENVIAIAAGYQHALAATADGGVWSWGYNQQGQLGNNAKADQAVPGPVRLLDDKQLTGMTGLAAGKGHSLAVHGTTTVSTTYTFHPTTAPELAIEARDDKAVLAEYTGRPDQQWRVELVGAKYRIVNVGTGRCLDAGTAQATIVTIRQTECADSPGQLWDLDPSTSSTARNGDPAGCLDVRGGDIRAGTEVIKYSDCHGKDNQRWTYQQVTG